MPDEPALLARGPWDPDEVEVHWSDDHYDAPPARVEAADAAIAALRDRGSPSHDGLSARLVGHEEHDGKLTMHLQPTRWALRLVEGDASLSVAALCVTRAATGAGWPAAARRGCRRGPGAGRWAPAARSTSARAPSTRSRASSTRSGRSPPSACAARRSCASRTGS